MTKLLAIAVLVLSFAPAPAECRQTAQNGPLKIVVIAGEGAVNVVRRKAAAPVVEVRDRNDLPVAGATVTFAISVRNRAAFAGGAQRITVTTNADGRATAAAINPLSYGSVQIQVSASFQGQAGEATIAQTNVMTAPQAAAPAGPSASSGGGISATTIGQLAVVGGAAVLAVKLFNSPPAEDPPVMSWIVETFAEGVSITPCRSPTVPCELKLSNNTGIAQVHIDLTGIPAVENKLLFECGGCRMLSGSGSEETYAFASTPAHQEYKPALQFSSVGVFPFRATWTSGGATIASFSIVFTVVP